MKSQFSDAPRKRFEKEVIFIIPSILFSLLCNWSYFCERTVFQVYQPKYIFLIVLTSLKSAAVAHLRLTVKCAMWQAESVVGMEEFVPQFPCVLCVGTDGGGTLSCCYPCCTVLQLAFPADASLLPLLPVRLLNSSQKLELDFSLFCWSVLQQLTQV